MCGVCGLTRFWCASDCEGVCTRDTKWAVITIPNPTQLNQCTLTIRHHAIPRSIATFTSSEKDGDMSRGRVAPKLPLLWRCRRSPDLTWWSGHSPPLRTASSLWHRPVPARRRRLPPVIIASCLGSAGSSTRGANRQMLLSSPQLTQSLSSPWTEGLWLR